MSSADPVEASGSYPKGDRRKAEIVGAAFGAFSADSYRGSSMVQIAAACGVSRAGLQHHFPTKEALLAAVLEERDRVNGELFFTGADPASDGLDYFRRLVRLVEHNAGQREIVRLFATLSVEASDPEHPAAAYFAARYQWLRADIRAALRELVATGRANAQAVDEATPTDIIALIDGLQIQWLLEPASVDLPARLRSRLNEILVEPID